MARDKTWQIFTRHTAKDGECYGWCYGQKFRGKHELDAWDRALFHFGVPETDEVLIKEVPGGFFRSAMAQPEMPSESEKGYPVYNLEERESYRELVFPDVESFRAHVAEVLAKRGRK